MPPQRLAVQPARSVLPHDEPDDVMMESGPPWDSAFNRSPSPILPSSGHLNRSQSLCRFDYPIAQPYPPYCHPQVPILTPEQHFGQPGRSFSSLASITPTPSPPPYGYYHMMDMSDDERSRSRSQAEDWRNVEDKGERRKIQNRNAQRKHRESPPLRSHHTDSGSSLPETVSNIRERKQTDRCRQEASSATKRRSARGSPPTSTPRARRTRPRTRTSSKPKTRPACPGAACPSSRSSRPAAPPSARSRSRRRAKGPPAWAAVAHRCTRGAARGRGKPRKRLFVICAMHDSRSYGGRAGDVHLWLTGSTGILFRQPMQHRAWACYYRSGGRGSCRRGTCLGGTTVRRLLHQTPEARGRRPHREGQTGSWWHFTFIVHSL